MNARFVTWTIVAMCLTVAGCGPDSPSIPLAPTPSTPPPAPTPPPPPRSLVGALTGDYALTFEVGNGCEAVPKEFRTRTYEARIEYWKSSETADLFFAKLSGATFHSYYPVLLEVSSNSVGMDLSDNMILEEASPGAYVAIAGPGLAFIEPTELSTISASFTGYFNYCAGTRNQCSPDAMVRSLCRSENSRWTLTRR